MISERISSLQDKRSYRSATLADYYNSLDVNAIYIHKGKQKSLESVKINGELGPVCTKDQLFKDVKQYRSKVRNQSLKRIYNRIIENFQI